MARTVLEAAGGCAVLLNATYRLNLAGNAKEIELQPLDLSAAEQLFLSRSGLASASLAPLDAALVRKICQRMRRLPLGITLAALKCAEGESLQT